jgi:hypothetical protein
LKLNDNISNDKVLLNSQIQAHLYMFGKNQLEVWWGLGWWGGIMGH